MNSFFDDIAKKAADLKAYQEANDREEAANVNFVEDVLPDIERLVREYDARLRPMGFKMNVTAQPREMSIALIYNDGTAMFLRITRDAEKGYMQYAVESSGGDAAYLPPTSRETHTRSSWTLDQFEEYFQKFVNAFTAGATEHGGL